MAATGEYDNDLLGYLGLYPQDYHAIYKSAQRFGF
jgi:hypothetical protein